MIWISFVLIFVQIVSNVCQSNVGISNVCRDSKDCKSNECCVDINTPRGKRAVVNNSSIDRTGKCQKLGKNGSVCLVGNGIQHPDNKMFYHTCPCNDGFFCDETGEFFQPLGELGVCLVKNQQKSCFSGKDCSQKQCCVSNMTPVGKRAAEAPAKAAPGHCEPLGQVGSQCLRRNASVATPDIFFNSCPCDANKYYCKRNGIFVIPLGEMGKCDYWITK